MAENLKDKEVGNSGKKSLKPELRSMAWKLPLLAGLAFLTMKSCDAFKRNMQEATAADTTNSAAQAQQAKKPAQKQLSNTSSVANKILSYMTQPVFISSDFTRQITGTAIKVELLDMTDGTEEGTLYLSITAKDFDDSTLSRLTQNPAAVEFAKKGEDGDLVLGEYVYSKPGRYFFRFLAEDFKIRNDASVTTAFNSVTYTVTVKELANFISNESIYCGDLDFKVGERSGVDVTMANHGALVAIGGEPSLKRLVSSLIASCNTKEERAQVLLDFVSTEIRYDGNADMGGAEQLKRPSEVLMTRKADCSGKSILLASLLEQAGVDYRLIYLDRKSVV